jgi:branched-chain amino acid transport system permease protein
MNIMNFAHGEIYMLGAFFTYFIVIRVYNNIYLAIFLSMIMTGVLGAILERFLFRPLMGKFLPIMCATTGLMLVLQASAVLAFGLDVKHMPEYWPGSREILGFILPDDRLIALTVSIVLMVVLFVFLKRSRLGLAMTATAQNREGALLQGVNPTVMYVISMTVGSALAAIAGAFAGTIFLLDPFMGSTALMKGFTIIVIGGLGSLRGVVLGGLLLGLSDSLVAAIVGQQAAVIAPLVLVILILVIRPQGLWGHE